MPGFVKKNVFDLKQIHKTHRNQNALTLYQTTHFGLSQFEWGCRRQLNCNGIWRKWSGSVEIIVIKGEIANLEQFLLLSQLFIKSSATYP